MIDIRHYEPQSASEWNAFVAESKNGTFLFDRRYMDYHSDRFADSSLMVYRDGRLFALFPANREGDVLCSHRGLTYGGLVTGPSATASAVVEAFEAVNAYLRGEGLRRVVYKAVPWIYHRVPAEEDLYALFRVCRARLVARDISSAIMQPHRLKWHRDRRYGINRGPTRSLAWRNQAAQVAVPRQHIALCGAPRRPGARRNRALCHATGGARTVYFGVGRG